MRASHFLYYEGTTVDPIKFRDAFAERFGPGLTSLVGARSVLLYTQGDYDDPYLDDDPGPFLLCRTEFDSVGALLAALEANAGALNFGESEGLPVYEGSVSDEIMVGQQYPTANDAWGRDPLGAVSYFVAYPNTAGDRDDFLGYYTAHHPPLLGQLPGIRATVLHEPTDISAPLGLVRADHMLICDVSFDTLDALNASLLSDVRKELREDYQQFPPFTGDPVHSAMLAKRFDV
tara:strand:+ start:481 stop:1179 length:699 start_codon:yes stop_codon:yes gene_type:complete